MRLHASCANVLQDLLDQDVRQKSSNVKVIHVKMVPSVLKGSIDMNVAVCLDLKGLHVRSISMNVTVSPVETMVGSSTLPHDKTAKLPYFILLIYWQYIKS